MKKNKSIGLSGEKYTAEEIKKIVPFKALVNGEFIGLQKYFKNLDEFLINNNITTSQNKTEYLSFDEFSKELTGLNYEELKEETGCKDKEINSDKETENMNNYKKHFRKELEILKKGLEEEGDNLAIQEFIPLIEDITDIFSKQGHSGGSAPFYSGILAETIKKVLSFEPLSGITCEDSEFVDVADYVEGEDKHKLFQNKRLSSVFKEGKEEKPYYLDAIVWKGEEDYDTFTGTVDGINSRQFIKLPFTPKTFYIDVIKVDWDPNVDEDYHESEGWKYNYKIKNRNQLKEVAEYYDASFKEKDL